jgi:hypothetical protein
MMVFAGRDRSPILRHPLEVPMSASSPLFRCALVLFAVLAFAPVAMGEDEVPVPAWTVPAGWAKLEQQKPMRYATFTAGEGANKIEVVLSTFPGDVGGLIPNINRWRGQVGLGPITQDQLAANATAFENPGFTGYTMRLKGETQHMLGAIIKDAKAERSWFIKITGSPAALDAQEAAFTAFAKSFGVAKQ